MDKVMRTSVVSLQQPSYKYSIDDINLADPQVMARLVESLKYVFQIHHGIELPFVLGCSQCKDNEEALVIWITHILKQTEWVGADDLFNYLILKLKAHLAQYHEGWM
jgi:hypothetical protein